MIRCRIFEDYNTALKIFLLAKPMIDLLIKESKELLKDRENESTWFKVFTLFEKLIKAFETKSQVVEFFPKFADIVHRSIQSDRSRLNGISLGFLKRCVEMAENDFSFNSFVGPVLRLTGKSNRVFVSRAMDTLEALCKHADPRCLLKNINDSMDSTNKNVRLASYTIVSWRVWDNYELFGPLVERGLKDPAQEVRNICKSIAGIRSVSAGNGVEIKKNAIASATPRKNFKVDRSHKEIKKIEHEVVKITKEQLVRKPIQRDFFERLNQLKKERHAPLEKKEDDLTPRRLDRYLNKFRCKLPDGLGFAGIGPDSFSNQKCPLKDSVQQEKMESAAVPISEQTAKADIWRLADSATSIQKVSEEAQASFIHETLLFKGEMDSSGHRDASIIHKSMNTSIIRQEINSDGVFQQEGAKSVIEDCEGLLVQDSLLIGEGASLSRVENDAVSDLSRSFAGIAIDPSKCGDSLVKEETGCIGKSPSDNWHDAFSGNNIIDNYENPREYEASQHSPMDISEDSCNDVEVAHSEHTSNDRSASEANPDCADKPRAYDLNGTPACGMIDSIDTSSLNSQSSHPGEHSPSSIQTANVFDLANNEPIIRDCLEKIPCVPTDLTGDGASPDRTEVDRSAIIGLCENEHNVVLGCGPEVVPDHERWPENVLSPELQHNSVTIQSDVKSMEVRILVNDDLDGIIGTDFEAGHTDGAEDSVLLNNVIADGRSLEKAGTEDQDSLPATRKKRVEDNRTLALNTVEDQGVQDVFCPEMSSRLSTHKLFDENIFGSDGEEASKSFDTANKPVFSIPIRVVSDSACTSNRLSLDSKQDTLLDNAPQVNQELDHNY